MEWAFGLQIQNLVWTKTKTEGTYANILCLLGIFLPWIEELAHARIAVMYIKQIDLTWPNPKNWNLN